MSHLVLSRKAHQSFFIGDHIKVTVHAIGVDQVKIGIEAPKEITVLREEIKDQQPTKDQQ